MSWRVTWSEDARAFIVARGDSDPTVIVRPREPQSEDQRLDAEVLAHVIAEEIDEVPHCSGCGAFLATGEESESEASGEIVCAGCRDDELDAVASCGPEDIGGAA